MSGGYFPEPEIMTCLDSHRMLGWCGTIDHLGPFQWTSHLYMMIGDVVTWQSWRKYMNRIVVRISVLVSPILVSVTMELGIGDTISDGGDGWRDIRVLVVEDVFRKSDFQSSPDPNVLFTDYHVFGTAKQGFSCWDLVRESFSECWFRDRV